MGHLESPLVITNQGYIVLFKNLKKWRSYFNMPLRFFFTTVMESYCFIHLALPCRCGFVSFLVLFFPLFLFFLKADTYLYSDFNTCFIPCVCKNNNSLGRTE